MHAAARVSILGLVALPLALGSAPAAKRASPCRPEVGKGSLPVWARGGFHPPTMRIPHIVGRSGRIVAILFAYPLRSPPPRDHHNKILWVAKTPVESLTNLRIRAQRMIGSRAVGAPVSRTVQGGPGPSYVNLPKAGCWRLTLRWARKADSLDLAYVPRAWGTAWIPVDAEAPFASLAAKRRD